MIILCFGSFLKVLAIKKKFSHWCFPALLFRCNFFNCCLWSL